MGDSKYELFHKNICSAVTSSIYYGWDNDLIDSLSSSERTIYYDSNIAFTSGDKSIVSGASGDDSLLAVPDLYGTLKGLNSRINSVNDRVDGIQEGEISTADAYLYVSASNNEHIISSGGGTYNEGDKTIASNSAPKPNSISIQGSKDTSTSKFTVNGDDFAFTVDGNTITLTDLLKMIEELRARTALIKTNVTRNLVTGAPYFSADHTTFGVNIIQ